MRKIVIVDDDPHMSRLMRTLFELEGFEVVTAHRYQDILPTIQQARPDAILMDVRVQGQETLDLVRQIRREPDLTDTPVVMTSGMDYQRQCLEAGANCFLLKPFVPDEMVRAVGTLLRTAE
ncbi:MAG: response regulator [Thermoflexales bacterium]|nr:response regulator [Thermoflexales bacterium]